MTLTRRQTLSMIGGGVILAAGASAATFATSRTPHRALAPWGEAGGYADARLNALSHAILAPNAHNRQPWLVELDGEHDVILHVDRTRLLPVTDPYDRQITISLGCFLEQMRIAASATGHAVEIEPFPTGAADGRLDHRPVALIRFIPGGASRDPLVDAIPNRRSTKEAFDMTRIPDAPTLAAFEAAGPGLRVETTGDARRVGEVRDLMWAAWLTEYATPDAHMESVDVMRFGKAEIEANPDGIDLGGPFLEGLMVAGLMNRELTATPGTTAYEQGRAIYEGMLAATPAAVWIVTETNDRIAQLEAGAAWLRLNLATTAAGLALHPVSQALQEYPEMAPHHARAHALLAPGGGTVQMLGRIGYADPVPQTPRWSLDAKLLPQRT